MIKMGIFDFFKPNPEKLMEKGDIEGLTKALKYKDQIVRQTAIKYLAIIAAGAYKEYEILWARDAPRIRSEACWAIAKAFQESEDFIVRSEAALFLKTLYERGQLPKELKKDIRKIMPELEKMFGKKEKAK